MRPVHLADIDVAARVLLAHAPTARKDIMAELVAHADVADRYRKKFGRRHPAFGAGTIMSAAANFRQVPRPSQIDADVLDALGAVIKGLLDRRSHHLL